MTLLFLFGTTCAAAQEPKSVELSKQEQKDAKRKQRDAIERMLTPFTVCPANGTPFVVFAVNRVAKNQNESLVRQTPDGVKKISRTDSYDVLITFTDKMRFADVRPDRSKPESYADDKKVVLENLQYDINTSKSMAVETPAEKQFNGFDTFSLYRSELIGNTPGISLIFDDANKMIVTVYFMNAVKGNQTNFRTIQEWMGLRDSFLDSYTKCLTDRKSIPTDQPRN